MTLIASFIDNDIPIILGDLLITSETEKSYDSISIPTVHSVNKYLEEYGNVKVTGLAQKLNIISDNICIAWTGDYIKAKTFIKYIHENCGEKNISEDKYNKIIDDYDKKDLIGIESFSYFFDKDNNRFSRRDLNCPMFEFQGIKDVYVGGTGTETFIQSIEQFINVENFTGDGTVLDKTVGKTLGFVSTAFGRQLINGSGLLDRWGGGFEIVYPDKDKFVKLDNIAYINWVVKKLPNGEFEIQNMPLFVKSFYENERLIIYLYDWSDSNLERRMYIADPLFYQNEKIPFLEPNLDYNWIVNHYFYRDDKSGDSYSFNSIGRSIKQPLKISRLKNGIKIEFNKEHYEREFKSLIETKPF